jgi:hypothetical protein
VPRPEPEPQFDGDYKKLGYKWKDFERSLKSAEDSLNETTYDPYLNVRLFTLPRGTTVKSLEELLSTKALPQMPSLRPPPPIKLRSRRTRDQDENENRDVLMLLKRREAPRWKPDNPA